MKTIRTATALAVMVAVVGGRLAAAEPAPDKDARARAAFYQDEARSEMKWMLWRIITNSPGRLVGTKSLPSDHSGGDTRGYWNLIVTFQPKSKTDTECGINKVLYLYIDPSSYGFHKKFMGPFVQTDARSVGEINGILARARRSMLKAHPEYGAPASR